MVRRDFQETKIFLPARDRLRDDEIMRLQTPSGMPSGIVVTHGNEALFPPARENGGRLVDSLSVVAEGVVKRRAFADRSIDQLRSFGSILRIDVGLDRDQQLLGSVGKGSRIAWLPITTISVSLAIAARMMCSRSSRLKVPPPRTHGLLARCATSYGGRWRPRKESPVVVLAPPRSHQRAPL